MSTFYVSSQGQKLCLLNIDSITWHIIDAQLVEPNKIPFITLCFYTIQEKAYKNQKPRVFSIQKSKRLSMTKEKKARCLDITLKTNSSSTNVSPSLTCLIYFFHHFNGEPNDLKLSLYFQRGCGYGH